MSGRHAKPEPQKRPKRATEPEDLAAAVVRMIGHHDVATGETSGLLARCKQDPSNLVLLREIRDLAADKYMEGFALAARSAQEGGVYTYGDFQRLMDISRPTAYQNARKGQGLLDEAREKLGVVVFRKRRQDALEAAELEDRRAKVVPLREADTA